MKKSITKKIAIACASFVSLLIFCRANIAGYVFPFGQALAFALAYNQVMPVVVAIELFCALAIQNFSVSGFICAATSASVLFIYFLIQKISNNRKLYLCLIFCLFSYVASVYFAMNSVLSLVCSTISAVSGVLFCFLFSKLISSFMSRGVQGLAYDDIICLCFAVVALASGLSEIFVFSFDVSKMLSVIILLCLALVLKNHAILFSACYCFGVLVTNLNPICLILHLIVMSVGQILQKNKYLLCSSVVFFDGLIIYLLKQPAIDILPTVIACVMVIAVPYKIYKQVGDYILGTNLHAIASFLIESKQTDLKNKLMTMSFMFDEMQNCYRNIIFSGDDVQKTYSFAANEVKNQLCSKCINYMRCFDGKDMTPDFEYLIEVATKKEKINFLDVPNLLASNCTKLGSCLTIINDKAQSVLQIQNKQKKENEEKTLSSVQYGAIGGIFKELSSQFAQKLKINQTKSERILKKCAEYSLVCKECFAFEDENGLSVLFLTVRNSDGVNPAIIDACNSEYKMTLSREMCKPTKFAGWSVVKIVPAQKYEVVCGIATKPKDEQSKNGDNYIFSKISAEKYLVAIADGMGNGENANKISETAVKLIESYYKCGFSDMMVATSVNNMLVPITNNYSTIDISVVDIKKGMANFIKLGSTISVVKKSNQSFVVDVESLPAGAEEFAKPTIQTAKLDVGDIVVMASDGVVDNFGIEHFCEYINSERVINMQIFAENILEEALSRNQSVCDDMTVIAYKIAKLH